MLGLQLITVSSSIPNIKAIIEVVLETLDNWSSCSKDMAFKLVFSVGPLVAAIVTKGNQLSCLSCILSLCSSMQGIKVNSEVVHDI